jgi:ribulose bisphosphate carboxylase small subunit
MPALDQADSQIGQVLPAGHDIGIERLVEQEDSHRGGWETQGAMPIGR